ncbi:MAG: cysteinyl-tRNA synthetase, partial [Patescibacteria group bacterium]|nr:cysteinyl-tRNA synthetase [Patescibacteria group bacterium]
KLRIKMQEFENDKTENNPAKTEEYKNQFIESLNDDLNMPQALATVWQVVKDEVLSGGDKKSLLLDFDKVLGLDLEKIESFEIPENVQNLIKERDLARNNKDFAKSDEIRAEIEKLGFEVKDTPEGTRVSPR